MHQRPAGQRPVLLEVQQLPDIWLLHEDLPTGLHGAQAQGDLVCADDGDQPIVHAILHDDFGVAHSADLPEQQLVSIAIGLLLLHRLSEIAILVLALGDRGVRDVRQLLLKRFAIQPGRGDEQREDVGDDTDAPIGRQLADLVLLPLRVEGQQRVRRLALVPLAEGARGLVRREIGRSGDRALRVVLRRLLRLPTGGVQRPPARRQALPQDAELVLLVDLAIEARPEHLQAHPDLLLGGALAAHPGEGDRRPARPPPDHGPAAVEAPPVRRRRPRRLGGRRRQRRRLRRLRRGLERLRRLRGRRLDRVGGEAHDAGVPSSALPQQVLVQGLVGGLRDAGETRLRRDDADVRGALVALVENRRPLLRLAVGDAQHRAEAAALQLQGLGGATACARPLEARVVVAQDRGAPHRDAVRSEEQRAGGAPRGARVEVCGDALPHAAQLIPEVAHELHQLLVLGPEPLELLHHREPLLRVAPVAGKLGGHELIRVLGPLADHRVEQRVEEPRKLVLLQVVLRVLSRALVLPLLVVLVGPSGGRDLRLPARGRARHAGHRRGRAHGEAGAGRLQEAVEGDVIALAAGPQHEPRRAGALQEVEAHHQRVLVVGSQLGEAERLA
mmetsp:Transcript_32687/g.92955  ORF Transcript_32687/g.92955 Transcript_32687/m.92955 type:complete len:615 (-) Transcript_32687:20-1864(-)